MNKKVCILGIVIILLDQISKNIVSSIFSLGRSIKVIKDFFYLTYVHNFGGAWSIFNNRVPLLVIATFIIIFILIKYMAKFKINKRNTLAFGLLFGGIISNLIDRICFGYVKDFLDFKIFNYNYPVFNIADIAIVVGVFLMIIAIIKGEDKNGTNSN